MKPKICFIVCIDQPMEDMQYLLKVLTKAAPKYKFVVSDKQITSINTEELIKHIKSN